MRTLLFLLGVIFATPLWIGAQVTSPMSQYNYARTGANLQEWMLTPSNVDPTHFGKLFSSSVKTVYAYR